jgi:Mrp family chromosome partitioning ATPase
MVDIGMRRLLDERDGIQDDLDRARIYYGENHIFVERERMSLEDANQRVQQYVNDYVGFRAGLAAMPPVASTAQTGAIPEAAAQAPPLSASMQQIQNQLDDADRRIDVLKTEAAMPKRLEVVTTGDFPVSVPGRQIKATLAAGTAGASLTVAFMVATGLLRRRYKYCSEITEALAEKTRFVAALPRLDDKNDLHQWHDAALCVHHLRQTLEHDSNVYLVTSADWSDGRTSTVMSLALSLSGAGIRTLVIDADLANRGLTRMLKLNDEPGFFELLDGKDFTASRISPNSLAIMPVGQASEADGLSISESVLSPLLARARASFDVVLIDAGPVLSRIETIEIARQVDGVLLTVPRGQHRSLVAQALRELELAQANVVGVIFNRVEPKDFYRSIKRRGSVSGPVSQPHPVPQALGEFGPLVRAVAMSLNKDVELSRIIGANRNTLVGGGPGRDKQVA